MALTREQINELKSQLRGQIKDLPPEKKKEAEAQIESLSPEALEEMLEEQQSSSNKTIFRMIIDNEIPSVKLSENDKALAVLSTKSISKGHTLIIPKSPVKDEKSISDDIYAFSEGISKKLISSLNAKSTEVISEKAFGEVVLNVIPIYDKPLSLKSKREDATVEDLEKIKTSINVQKINKNPTQTIKIEKKDPEILKIKRRIP